MARTQQSVHVARSKSRRVNKDGNECESVLLRRSYLEDSKVRHETLANLAALPEYAVESLRASSAGKTLIEVTAGLEVVLSLPAGRVDAITRIARGLGFEAMLGPDCRERDVVMAPITARIWAPTSKLASLPVTAATRSPKAQGHGLDPHPREWGSGPQLPGPAAPSGHADPPHAPGDGHSQTLELIALPTPTQCQKPHRPARRRPRK
jgi:hypothetical protein